MALNTQTSSPAKGNRPKRSRSDDAPPPPSSSVSIYGPPPKTEEEYLEFCLILLAHCGAATADKEGPVIRSSTEEESELTSCPLDAMPLTVVAPEFPSAPVDAKPLTMVLAGKYYECLECGRSFSSFRALGGHKASHRNSNNADDGKDHECGICHRIFSSGQALGGHKRRHFEGKIDACNRREQGVEKAASTSEGGSRSRSEGSMKSAVSGTGQSSSSENRSFCSTLTCFRRRRPRRKPKLSPVLPPATKRSKLLSFDALFPK